MSEQYKVNGVLYRQQYRKCGKAGCKCATGEGHGPYWYSYDGSSAAKYVGSQLPEHVAKHAKLLKSSAAQIRKLKEEIKKRRDHHRQQYNMAEQDLRTIDHLETGERVDPTILIKLGLDQFNPRLGER